MYSQACSQFRVCNISTPIVNRLWRKPGNLEKELSSKRNCNLFHCLIAHIASYYVQKKNIFYNINDMLLTYLNFLEISDRTTWIVNVHNSTVGGMGHLQRIKKTGPDSMLTHKQALNLTWTSMSLEKVLK